MATKITKVVSQPIQVLKKTGKTILEPAGKSNVYAIAGGVAVSPLISYGYGKFFDWVSGFFPNLPNWAKIVLKLGLPLIPVPLIAKFKIPAGGVINGTLLGMFFTQIALMLYEVITGKSISLVKKTESALDSAETGSETDWGAF